MISFFLCSTDDTRSLGVKKTERSRKIVAHDRTCDSVASLAIHRNSFQLLNYPVKRRCDRSIWCIGSVEHYPCDQRSLVYRQSLAKPDKARPVIVHQRTGPFESVQEDVRLYTSGRTVQACTV